MRRPEFTDMMEAARVASFMEAASVGRWKIKHFTIDQAEYHLQMARAIAEGGPNREQRIQRTVPPGDYVMLGRKATPDELRDIESGEIVDGGFPDEDFYVPIMSDTPAEIAEHAHALENATGRVLITGLGLGCIVSALLAKKCARCDGTAETPDDLDGEMVACPDCKGTGNAVEHITVVEIDRDVIALTGPYYEDEPRVTIVNHDALKYAHHLYIGDHFDYAWHDIYSHIADRNLDDDSLAEHGISYKTLFEAYAPFVREQSAWAWPEAKEMRDNRLRAEAATTAWAQQYIDADFETRVRLLTEFKCREALGLPHDVTVPPDVYAFFGENMGYTARSRELATDPHIVAKFQSIISEDDDPGDPMARPNEDPEANVAR